MCCDGGWQAWRVNRYAMVARKHGLYHTSINIINQMYGFNAMEVQEAFTKIKEQVPCNAPPPFHISHRIFLSSCTQYLTARFPISA